MCILFFYVNKAQNKGSAEHFYRLILASNRDEVFTRPTKEASFWESDPNILAGRDEEAGGTWLGVSRGGRVGALLNIMGRKIPGVTTSRGSFITNFLQSPKSISAYSYCKNLSSDPELPIRTQFNPFNFIAIDVGGTNSDSVSKMGATYLTNASQDGNPIDLFEGAEHEEEQYFTFGNTTIKHPMAKVSNGRVKFQHILSPYLKSGDFDKKEDALVMDLLQFLKSNEKNYPDPLVDQLGSNHYPPEILQKMTANFVRLGGNYGTRTHTIILIDNRNEVRFEEWTLPGGGNLEDWKHSKYEFKMDL